MQIDASRFREWFVDGEALMVANPLAGEEMSLLKALNAQPRNFLKAFCTTSKLPCENPIAVGLDDAGIDVRRAHDVVRLPFPLRFEQAAQVRSITDAVAPARCRLKSLTYTAAQSLYRAELSQATLMDVYMRPWRAAIAAGLRGLMVAHPEVAGLPNHGNGPLLSGVVRGMLGGAEMFFASDAGDIEHIASHGITASTTDLVDLYGDLSGKSGGAKIFSDGARCNKFTCCDISRRC
jgi:hypothetical protein